MKNKEPKQQLTKALKYMKLLITVMIVSRILAIITGILVIALPIMKIHFNIAVPQYLFFVVVIIFCVFCALGGVGGRGRAGTVNIRDMIIDYKQMKEECRKYELKGDE